MPLTRTQLAADTKSLPPINVGEGTITFVYRRPTPKYIDETTAKLRQAGDAVSDSVGIQFLGILADWDYFEDDEQKKKMPINAENLSTLPYDVLREALNMIMEAEKPTPNG